MFALSSSQTYTDMDAKVEQRMKEYNLNFSNEIVIGKEILSLSYDPKTIQNVNDSH